MFKDERTFCGFSMKKEQKELLQKIAEKDDRSLSSLLQKIINDFLQKYKKELDK